MVLCRLRKRGSLGKWVFIFIMVFYLHQTFIAKNNLTAVPYRMAMDAGALFDIRTESKIFQELIQRQSNDPELVDFVRSHLIQQPSGKEYNLTNPQFDRPSRDQSTKVDRYLQRQENGTFIDIGAGDGEFDSVTLFFERHRNWNGLLVEPDKEKFQRMKQKQRKSSILNACVKNVKTKNISFKVSRSKLEVDNIKHCLHMETILHAYRHKNIDLITVDVHNKEVSILQSIPLDKFYIRVIVLELSNDQLEDLPNLYLEMDRKGYFTLHQFTNRRINKVDVIFVNKKNGLPLKVT